MGGQNYYKAEGGFSQYLYQHVGDVIEYNGIHAKVIEYVGTKDHHEGLPYYSNTSDMYLKIADNQTYVEKAIVYVDRHAAFELDWGHPHTKRKEMDNPSTLEWSTCMNWRYLAILYVESKQTLDS